MRVNASRVEYSSTRFSWLLKRHAFGAAIVCGLAASIAGAVACGVSTRECGAVVFLVGYCVAGIVAATIERR